MKRSIVLGVVMCLSLCSLSSDVKADNYYRINMRAYRKMLHYQLPHPFADRFWGVVDNQLLQPGGPFDQLIKSILAKNLNNPNNQTGADGPMVAKRSVVPDPDLLASAAKIKVMCEKLGVPYEALQQNATTGNNTGTVNLVNRDPRLAVPAPAPDDIGITGLPQ